MLAEPVADRDGARAAGALDPNALRVAFRRARAVLWLVKVLFFHASPKPIPCPDARGRAVAPRDPNGYKLERFVFDLHPEARAPVMAEARREDEYAPVEHAVGGESSASARRALEACTRRWLGAAGVRLPSDTVALELDHSVIDRPEDAASPTVRDALAAGCVVRLGPGAIA